jgi:hypothetical protein
MTFSKRLNDSSINTIQDPENDCQDDACRGLSEIGPQVGYLTRLADFFRVSCMSKMLGLE